VNLDQVDLSVFRLSLQVGVMATVLCIVVGLPLAWWIARAHPLVGGVLSSLVLLPLVLPPTVIGYYVLYVLGRQSRVGRFLIDDLGIRLVFTWQGAAIAAAIVSLPLFVRTAQAGFESLNSEVVQVAHTLAPRPLVFLRVVLPMAWPALAAAVLIAFARGVGEFGATVIVAGNIPGVTQTAPTAIYDAVQAGNSSLANTLALLLLLAGLVLLAGLSFFLYRARTFA
jgi:molybdate transport system permease protein